MLNIYLVTRLSLSLYIYIYIYIYIYMLMAQLAGVIEYTDCIFAEGQDSPQRVS